MSRFFAPRSGYTRAERQADAAIHVIGLGAAILAVPVLIGLACMRSHDSGSASFVIAISIYGATFMAMIGASALFNLGLRPGFDWLFQRLDHAAI